MNYEYVPSCQIEPSILDAIYTEAFGVKGDGVFVEVGANDGYHCSNTWGLARRGWQGVYVEPLRGLAAQCRLLHKENPGIRVETCCIGAFNGEVEMGMCEFGATLSPEWMQGSERFGSRQLTLNRLLTDHQIKPGFDLLVIDVEGAEAQVLEGFALETWLPEVVIIERPPFRNHFRGAGYRAAYVDNVNTVFVREKQKLSQKETKETKERKL